MFDFFATKGNKVTALVSSSKKNKFRQANCNQGYTIKFKWCRNAIVGCDSVVSTLSGIPESDIITFKKVKTTYMLEMTIRSTIKCMYESGIRDIVTLNLAT
jgi:hypothetical protein